MKKMKISLGYQNPQVMVEFWRYTYSNALLIDSTGLILYDTGYPQELVEYENGNRLKVVGVDII